MSNKKLVWHRCPFEYLGAAHRLCSHVEVDAIRVRFPDNDDGMWMASHHKDLREVGCRRLQDGSFKASLPMEDLLASAMDDVSIAPLVSYVDTCVALGIHPLIEITAYDVSILSDQLVRLAQEVKVQLGSRGNATLFTSDVRLLPQLGRLATGGLGVGVYLRQTITPRFQEWLCETATYGIVVVDIFTSAVDQIRLFKRAGADIVTRMVDSEEALIRASQFSDEDDGENGNGEVLFMVSDARRWEF